jgi:hypothetical protein
MRWSVKIPWANFLRVGRVWKTPKAAMPICTAFMSF